MSPTDTKTAERTRLNVLARSLLSRPLDRQRMSDWESEPKDLGSLVLKTISAYPARFTIDGLRRHLSDAGGMPYDLGPCIEWLGADLGAIRFSRDGRLSISPTITA